MVITDTKIKKKAHIILKSIYSYSLCSQTKKVKTSLRLSMCNNSYYSVAILIIKQDLIQQGYYIMQTLILAIHTFATYR